MMKGVLFAAASAISAFSDVCANFSTLCPTMAMFRTATLFSVVLLAFLVKHADGMRGPSQPASMIEREVTSWGIFGCAKFGARKPGERRLKGWCRCPDNRPKFTQECGRSGDIYGSSFHLSEASKGCRCVTKAEYAELLKIPVSASALRFCSALLDQTQRHYNDDANRFQDKMQSTLSRTSPTICQHALTGTITPTEAKQAPWAKEASELSQEDSVQDGDREYGRMQPVKENATTPGEKKLWEHALSQVCKDECDDLLEMMKEEAWDLADDVAYHQVPFAQTCAERVVKHVEAEVLGCCARSCGFNGRTCLLWPFFSPREKVNWNLECCSEMNVLKNSSRERMCNSVLSDHLATEASQYDLEEKDGTDVGKVLIGQNSSLFWTKKGAQQARRGIKLRLPKKSTKKAGKFINKLLHPFGKSVLIKEAGARADANVSMDFLLKHPNVGEEFLRRGYFREEPLSKMLDQATSVMEGNFQDDTCNFGKLQQQCPENFQETYVETCKKSWKVTQVPKGSENPEDEEDEVSENIFHDHALHPAGGHCDQSNSQSFATAEQRESLTTNFFGKIFVHYFTYDTENKEKPIKCFTLAKNQCKGNGQWWTKIPLVSVQELVKKEDINTYTDLVYVKVKADE